MNELSWLEINLSRLESNLAWWRGLLSSGRWAASSPPRICAVVKANAYGLGAVAISQRLAQVGVDMLAVYSPAQAEELIEAGIRRPILVLMPTRELEHTDLVRQAAAEGRVHLAINDPGQLDLVEQLGRDLQTRLPVHLHLDTGMSRAGLSRAEFAALLAALPVRRDVRLAGLFTHLATAHNDGAFDAVQLDRFDEAVAVNQAYIGGRVVEHVAATGGACRGQRYHKHMVRLGLGLYGYGPDQLVGAAPLPDGAQLAGVVRWLGRIVHIQRYPCGTPVGYGCTHHLGRDSVLGLVPVGYADGYPLSLSDKAQVRLVGPAHAAARVLGRVSMDQIIIDLTDLPQAKLGGTVELLSSDRDSPCALVRLAELADSSCYEVLCQLSPRLPRQYVSIETTPAATLDGRVNIPGIAPQSSSAGVIDSQAF